MAGDASGPDGRDDDARDVDAGTGSDRADEDRDDGAFVFGDVRPGDGGRADEHPGAEDAEDGEPSSESRSAERERIPLDLSDRPRVDPDGAKVHGEGDEEERIGPEPSSTPVESGTPTLENAIFVLLGAVLMMLVIVRLVTLFVV